MYKKLTEEEKKILESYPKYDPKNAASYVGSREYYETVLEMETNRDPELHKAFSELHHKLVNMVIQFCEEHVLEDVDEVHFGADGLSGSYGYHSWQCPTDSSMSLIKLKEGVVPGWNGKLPDRDNPFLYEI